MSKKEKNIIARRLVNSYLLSIVSISLVLLLVGAFGAIAINARQVSDYFKENIKISAILKENIKDEEAIKFQKRLNFLPAVKKTQYISKEQGTKEMKELLGQDFLDVFETNPVPISIELSLKANYFVGDSLEILKAELLEMPPVAEVSYQDSLVEILNKNMERIGFIIMAFILLLLFVSFVLINNTVRLNVYSKRFSIYTMRLVGATKSFIRAPFLVKAVFQGLLSGLLAAIALTGIFYFIRSEFEQLFSIFSMEMLAILLVGLVLLGMMICTICTFFVVNRLVTLS
ncbi:MAG: permease-like cell division protein FtsX, partial [Bacteroidales bacterium]